MGPRHRPSVRPLLAVALAAAALGLHAGGVAAQEASPPRSGSEPVLPGEPNVPWDDGATPASPDPSLVFPRRIRWDAVLVAPDGRTLTVYFRNGDPGCTGLAAIDVRPDDAGIAVEVTVGDVPGAPSCPPADQLYRTVVVLDEPLVTGARLFDLPSGGSSAGPAGL